MRNLAFFIAVTSSFLAGCAQADEGLNKLHAGIVADHAAVAQISPEAFLKLDPANTIVLDIRKPEEYAVSHIPGAVRISPGTPAETALIEIGDVKGKDIVVYCSVGKRSSIFAEREQARLLDMGAASVSNLERGVFGWHNEKRDLINAKGSTDAIHPYNNVWKRYVGRKEQARYTPIPED